MNALPFDVESVSADELPGVLLPYQQRLITTVDEHAVTFVEKSRRIGFTWGIAAHAVLTASSAKSAGGMDVLYMGYEREMTREFIDTCAMWAKAFGGAAVEVGEFLFVDGIDEKGQERYIQAFRIAFASGFEIKALCSRPRALRGKQGFVILDEAAFQDDLAEVLKAAVALLIWGGKLLVISTHDGVENAFNEHIQQIRAGKLQYALIRVTFDDAVRDGLYQRICFTQGKTWSAEAELAWVAQIRAHFPGDSADEELDCIPRQSGGKYLSRVLLEARGIESPVFRWSCPDNFVDRSDESRQAECLEWCEGILRPTLDGLPKDARHYLGEDFARSGDLTVMWVYSLALDLRRLVALAVELRNVPFREQETVLRYICDRLPRFSGAALDSRGNGQYLAERARQAYGAGKVSEVMLSASWYGEHWPRFKSALEDDRATIPKHADIVDDFRTIEVVRGVPMVVEKTGTGNEKRHGDSAIAAVLAWFASEQLDVGDVTVSGEGRATSQDALDLGLEVQEGGAPPEFYS